MTIFKEVKGELDRLNVGGWRRAVAEGLAKQLDAEPNASMARELRALMSEAGSRPMPVKQGSRLDELRAKREAKRASA